MPAILITGANRGLGLALATAFNQLGYKLYLVVRAAQSEQQLQAQFPDAAILLADVTAHDYQRALQAFLAEQIIDVLINNAGSGSSGNSLATVLPEQLSNEFNTHCVAALTTVQGAIVNLRKSAQPLILNISSRRGSLTMQAAGAAQGSGCSFSYRIGKAAQNMLTLCLADELAAQGITVAAIHPGRLLTDMAAKDAHMTPDKSAQIIAQLVITNNINSGDFLCVENGKLPW